MGVHSVGETLRELRRTNKKTIAKTAEELGISPSALAMYEQGRRMPRDAIKLTIARYYGKSVDSLFFNQ